MAGRNFACPPANRTELIGLGEVGFCQRYLRHGRFFLLVIATAWEYRIAAKASRANCAISYKPLPAVQPAVAATPAVQPLTAAVPAEQSRHAVGPAVQSFVAVEPAVQSVPVFTQMPGSPPPPGIGPPPPPGIGPPSPPSPPPSPPPPSTEITELPAVHCPDPLASAPRGIRIGDAYTNFSLLYVFVIRAPSVSKMDP